jgi:hypothetical protein
MLHVVLLLLIQGQSPAALISSGKCAFVPEAVVQTSDNRFLPIQQLLELNPTYKATRFIGLVRNSSVRLDLVPNRLVAHDVLSRRALWSLPARDAAVTRAGEIILLGADTRLKIDHQAKLLSRKTLPKGSYSWVRLDPEGRFVLGVNPKAVANLSQVALLRLDDNKVTKLQFKVDLGNVDVPKVVSVSPSQGIILEELTAERYRPHFFVNGRLTQPPTAMGKTEWFASDVTIISSQTWLLMVDSNYETSTVRRGFEFEKVHESKFELSRGFVMQGTSKDVLLYSYINGIWGVWRLVPYKRAEVVYDLNRARAQNCPAYPAQPELAARPALDAQL